MDVDRNGVLEGPELLAIANWIWLSFHPGGTQVSAREKESDEMLLLRRLDGNGVMNFDEFSSWFESACTRIEQGRDAARAHQGLERNLAATDTPVEDHSITQTLAQAAKEEASARVDALQEELYCERTAKEEATNARAQKEAEAQTLQQELRCEMIAKEQTANAIAEKAPQAEAL